ncbi:MAG: hypothetical protein ACREVZ_00355 [Burkholderiales bacterium]
MFGCGVAGAAFLSATPARAQFIGYTSPQTINATPLSNAVCTGGTVVSTPSAIPNLGQSFHYLRYLVTSTGALPERFRVSLQASYDGGIFFTISDVASDASSTGGEFVAFGQFPIFRVGATCLGGSGVQTITVSYSGTSVSSSVLNGDLDVTTFKKPFFFGSGTGANQFSGSLRTPYGSSAGVIAFQYLTAGVAGSTLNVLNSADSFVSSNTIATFTLANTTSPQFFFLPTLPVPQDLQINYVSGGASANTFNAELLFFKPGVGAADPCAPTVTKSSLAIVAGAAATTKIITEIANQTIYVCGYQVSQIATAGTLQWITGTGATCGTGTVNKTGAMGVTASQPIAYSGTGTAFRGGVGDAVCLTTTGAAGTAAGIITFVQM